jgi:hypothetical protein
MDPITKAVKGLKAEISSPVLRPFSAQKAFYFVTQGRRAPLRFALAPGFHISRFRRSAPLNTGRV